MAMQIIPAWVNGKDISFGDVSKIINVTDVLRPICDEYFTEESLFEEGEEITVEIARGATISDLSIRLEKEILLAANKLKKMKGEEAKAEIVLEIKDYVLFRSIIIAVLLVSNRQEPVLIIS